MIDVIKNIDIYWLIVFINELFL